MKGFSYLAAAIVLVACGADDGPSSSGPSGEGEVGSSTQHLSGAGGYPLPLKTAAAKKSAWNGSLPDLMVADAWATCAFMARDGSTPVFINHNLASPGDVYLERLLDKMRPLVTAYPSSGLPGSGATPAQLLTAWMTYRNDAEYNVRAKDGTKAARDLRAATLGSYYMSMANSALAATEAEANSSIGLAAVNVCIAQSIRSISLNTGMDQLSQAEQIQSLELTRERAQMAMLHYAALFNALASPAGTAVTAPNRYQTIAYLKLWMAANPANRDAQIQAWVNDFAAAFQLHVTAATELSRLFARSASSRSARGGTATSTPEEIWGPGSWRQRLLALLYGGDPLAADANGSTPWTNMAGRVAPGITLDPVVRPEGQWPSAAEMPFFSTSVRDERVATLLGLARRMDVQQYVVDGTGALDVEASAKALYLAVEAKLRSEQCLGQGGGFCAELTPAALTDAGRSFTEYAVWQTFKISLDHARVAVRLFSEYTPANGMGPVHWVGAVRQTGTVRTIPRDTAEVVRTLDEVAPLFERFATYRIPPTVDQRVERAHTVVGTDNLAYKVGDDQGLSAGGPYSESMRLFGVMPALSFVRTVLKRIPNSAASAPAKLLTAIAKISPSTLGVIDSTIGEGALRVEPVDFVSPTYSWGGGLPAMAQRLQLNGAAVAGANRVRWQVELDAKGGSFFSTDTKYAYFVLAVRNEPGAYALAHWPTARRPTDARTIADMANAINTAGADPLLGAIGPATLANDLLSANIDVASPLGTTSGWALVAVRAEKNSSGSPTDSAGKFNAPSFYPLAAPVPMWTWALNRVVSSAQVAPVMAFHFSDGGALGWLAKRLWTVQRGNPSEPAFDGFGLPINWVPTADPQAFGGSRGDTTMSFFLRNAKQAAAEATEAARQAADVTFREQQVELESQAAKSRSTLVLQQEVGRLCGSASEKDCAVNLVWAPIQPIYDPLSTLSWASLTTTCANALGAKDLTAVDCSISSRVRAATSYVMMAKNVSAAMSQTSTPTFGEFSGGEIQKVLTSQWGAVRRIIAAGEQIKQAREAFAKRKEAADSTLAQLNSLNQITQLEITGITTAQKSTKDRLTSATNSMTLQCLGMWDYFRSLNFKIGEVNIEFRNGRTGSTNVTVDVKGNPLRDQDVVDVNGAIDLIESTISGKEGKLTDWAHLRQLEASCQDAQSRVASLSDEAERNGLMVKLKQKQAEAGNYAKEASEATSLAEFAQGVGGIQRELDAMDAAALDLALTISDIARIKDELKMAKERSKLENQLNESSTNLSLGFTRQYHQYDTWRAQALLDGARRFAVAARRAIESQYVVDLGTLNNPEPFVAAPSAWADDVYRYDLSLPTAVGTAQSAGGNDSPGAVYLNQVLDYVGNLERFVQGFAVARPMAEASDAELISVPGPGGLIVKDGVVAADPMRSSWSVLCPKKTRCVSNGVAGSDTQPTYCSVTKTVAPSQACESTDPNVPGVLKPLEARATFFLDPWGQLAGRDQTRSFESRVNTRIGRLAINLVGNGIKDCSGALVPSDCLANQFLRYDLEHSGPVVAVGATQQWRVLNLPIGVIEEGKAATLGEFLDVQQNGWGRAFVEAVAREEFLSRPISGTFVLQLQGGETVNFDRLESLQLLVSNDYWVLQK